MQKNLIHVAIVEDDRDICQTLALIIDGTPGYSCKKIFQNCESAIPEITTYRPDVVLMDINLPGMSGIEGTQKLKTALPDLDIIMLTIQMDDHSIFESLKAGASGYLIKNTPPAELLQAITEVHEGGAPMSTRIARKVLASFRTHSESPLSDRESEILRQLCDGQNYKVIAENLFVSGHTIRTHIKNIYRKLHVNSRAEAVKKAIKDKLI
ncbi:MAG: response regulator transcription factor [Bacteroidia bacterium]